MSFIQRLLRSLNRAFDKDPAPSLALRMQYAGPMTWTVADGVLTTSCAAPFSVDLSGYTISQLVAFITARAGYSVPFINPAMSGLSALVLLDDTRNIAQSNGDHLYGFTSLLWAFFVPAARELDAVQAQIQALPLELSTTTADTIWLDTLGTYYNVPRLLGELDAAYGARIIAEVIRPKSNNVAMGDAITYYTGTAAKVTDVTVYTTALPIYDGSSTRSSGKYHNSAAQPRYGLFDVSIGYDLINGGSIATFQATMTSLIDRLRAAGTHLRALALTGSQLSDAVSAPDDGGAIAFAGVVGLADAVSAPTDTSLRFGGVVAISDAVAAPSDATDSITLSLTTTHNGQRSRNGAIFYGSGIAVASTIAGPP